MKKQRWSVRLWLSFQLYVNDVWLITHVAVLNLETYVSVGNLRGYLKSWVYKECCVQLCTGSHLGSLDKCIRLQGSRNVLLSFCRSDNSMSQPRGAQKITDLLFWRPLGQMAKITSDRVIPWPPVSFLSKSLPFYLLVCSCTPTEATWNDFG